ncbi:MAG: type IV pilus twitching motility protein PilT [Candidatus Sumerlaeota bacterium]|nr:type IV pilus twitching motility protein PilT [Candidatus Sumerlaeota bacterium]
MMEKVPPARSATVASVAPAEAPEMPAVQKINALLRHAVEEQASDLHLQAGGHPRFRIDGELYEETSVTLTDAELTQHFRETLKPDQFESFLSYRELDLSTTLAGVCRMRINLFRQRGAFCAAFRIIPDHIPSMKDIYLPRACYHFTQLSKGLVLVTGPTGCGKTTTLAAMIDHINQHRRCHILTIEDPIEYLYENKMAMVSQREVDLDTLSFDMALRHSFRQDPDVILIGEMRDLETIQTALTLAETGHLTFSTLHTGEAPQTVSRIVDAFPLHNQSQIRAQLAASLEGIISQQLLPLHGKRGRVAAREVLVCTRAVKNMIREGKVPQISSAIQTGADVHMVPMNYSLGHLYKRGIVSYEVALAAAYDKTAFQAKYGPGR